MAVSTSEPVGVSDGGWGRRRSVPGRCAIRHGEFVDRYGNWSRGGSGGWIRSRGQLAPQHDANHPLLSDAGTDVADRYGVGREDYDGTRRVHQRTVLIVDDTRTTRGSSAIEDESPDSIDLNPISDVLRELLAQHHPAGTFITVGGVVTSDNA